MYKCVNGELIEMTAEEVVELEALRAGIVETPTEQDILNAGFTKDINEIKIDLGK